MSCKSFDDLNYTTLPVGLRTFLLYSKRALIFIGESLSILDEVCWFCKCVSYSSFFFKKWFSFYSLSLNSEWASHCCISKDTSLVNYLFLLWISVSCSLIWTVSLFICYVFSNNPFSSSCTLSSSTFLCYFNISFKWLFSLFKSSFSYMSFLSFWSK